MEEGKGQGGLATSHQYGNALLGVCYQEEEEAHKIKVTVLGVRATSMLCANRSTAQLAEQRHSIAVWTMTRELYCNRASNCPFSNSLGHKHNNKLYVSKLSEPVVINRNVAAAAAAAASAPSNCLCIALITPIDHHL